MSQLYPHSPAYVRQFPLGAFLRASSLHIGAAAAAAALRRELVDRGSLSGAEFDEAYAVARLTPGTNLLAMYTLIGRRLSGWSGAVLALIVGAIVPAAIAIMVSVVFVTHAANPAAARAMQGARAGALAVFLWAVVRLLRPQLNQHGLRGALLGFATLAVVMALPVPQFVVLLAAGGIGATFFRTPS